MNKSKQLSDRRTDVHRSIPSTGKCGIQAGLSRSCSTGTKRVVVPHVPKCRAGGILATHAPSLTRLQREQLQEG